MAKKKYTTELKVSAVTLSFTTTTLSKEDIAVKYGISLTSIDNWRSVVFGQIASKLSQVYKTGDTPLSSKERAEAVRECLVYDCEIADVATDYDVDEDVLECWVDTIITSLPEFLVNKKSGSNTRPIRPLRVSKRASTQTPETNQKPETKTTKADPYEDVDLVAILDENARMKNLLLKS